MVKHIPIKVYEEIKTNEDFLNILQDKESTVVYEDHFSVNTPYNVTIITKEDNNGGN